MQNNSKRFFFENINRSIKSHLAIVIKKQYLLINKRHRPPKKSKITIIKKQILLINKRNKSRSLIPISLISLPKKIRIHKSLFLTRNPISKERPRSKSKTNSTNRVSNQNLTENGPIKPSKVSWVTDVAINSPIDEDVFISFCLFFFFCVWFCGNGVLFWRKREREKEKEHVSYIKKEKKRKEKKRKEKKRKEKKIKKKRGKKNTNILNKMSKCLFGSDHPNKTKGYSSKRHNKTNKNEKRGLFEPREEVPFNPKFKESRRAGNDL